MTSDLSYEQRCALALQNAHRATWRDKSDWCWLWQFLKEVWELVGTLAGWHHHSTSSELQQIASIAINWMEMRAQK